MSVDSFNLVEYLKEKQLLDRIETRYIIFDVSKIDMTQFDYIMYLANVFEVKWLNYIKSRYESYASKDANRIIMIQKRLDANPVNKK
jgi:reverse gyrase